MFAGGHSAVLEAPEDLRNSPGTSKQQHSEPGHLFSQLLSALTSLTSRGLLATGREMHKHFQHPAWSLLSLDP